jgi:3-hydroxyacyl-[acyl-carrier-protein] dehydratase
MVLKDFYQLKSIIEKEENNFEVFVKLNKSHDIFKGHFPNNPITPGVCMLQIVKNISEEIYNKPLLFHNSNSIKFLAIINPEINPELKLILGYKIIEESLIEVVCTVFIEDKQALSLKVQYNSVF